MYSFGSEKFEKLEYIQNIRTFYARSTRTKVIRCIYIDNKNALSSRFFGCATWKVDSYREKNVSYLVTLQKVE